MRIQSRWRRRLFIGLAVIVVLLVAVAGAFYAALKYSVQPLLDVAALSRGSAPDAAREEDLSRVWSEAAAALHGIDDDLAQRCRLKGEYWAGSDQWKEPQLREARILLTQVASDADALLGWSGSGT